MSDWLLRRRYGFGAGRIALCAEPHTAAGTDWTVREGLREARRSAGSWRDIVGISPAITMGIAIALAPLLAFVQQSLIAPDVDLVLLETAIHTEAPPTAATPRPQPAEVAEEPEPPPPPAAPAPPKPPPIVASAPATPPAPAPEPAAPPRIEPVPLAASAPATSTQSTPRRNSRASARRDPAPAFQVARVSIDALATAKDSTHRDVARRNAPGAPAQDRRPAPPPVRFDAAIPMAPPIDEAVASSRPARHVPSRGRRPERNERPAGVALPASLAPEPAPSAAAIAKATPAGRAERPRDQRTTGNARASKPGVAGVALASLASCRTDAQEDALKQRVLAEVAGRGQCESSAGRYVFVETRNLNAFLMLVQRPSSRRETDRCVELSLALDCLRQPGEPKAGRV